MAVFDRGDIVSIAFVPADHSEMPASHLALVLTTKEFNKLGDVLVAPISKGDIACYAGFAVRLADTGCKTEGAALVNKIRMLDLVGLKARRVERAPLKVIEEALGRLEAVLAISAT